jgi:N-acetylmuramoyl-L-alanine amidase
MIDAVFLTCLLAFTAAAGGPSADEAYSAAKSEYQKLKGDQKRRALRHHWQNVAKKFEAVATKFPKSDRAPEALFKFGELNEELSRFSQRDEDLEAAKKSYRKLLEGWPKHRLSDDAAWSLAHVLAFRDGDVGQARVVLEAALKNAHDRKKDLQSLLSSLPAPKQPARPAVVKAVPPPAKSAAPAAPSPRPALAKPANDVAEAIRRALNPMNEEPPVQARRVIPSRPPPDEASERASPEISDEVVEPTEPMVASLAEKLRDVRLGAKDPEEEASAARARFKKLAKDGGNTELSLAQQLGLKVRRVVVDAGHGGHDTGAIGPGGTREKDAALAIAKKLAAKLEAAGLEVVLTRDDDTFVKLEDRTRIANRQKGDLFISIHCNAAQSNALRGIETYTLNTSSNRYSIRLAARENATTERGVGDLQYILADLATKANTGESSHLAERVQRSLVRDLGQTYKGVKDLGTKEALFFVLLGAKMPSILVETSFISNPEEEQRLADDGYQQKVADSIAEAVGGFLEERSKVAQVD